MADDKILVKRATMQAIADVIRENLNSDDKYKPSDMPDGVREVFDDAYSFGSKSGYQSGYNKGFEDGKAEGGSERPSGVIEIAENGTHDVTNYAEAVVNVPIPEYKDGNEVKY